MGDERHTPPGLPPTQWRLSQIERQAKTDHDRLHAVEVAVEIGIGRDGRGGRLAETGIERDVMRTRVERIERSFVTMDKNQAVANVKLALVVAFMSAVGGIAGAIVLRALFGG